MLSSAGGRCKEAGVGFHALVLSLSVLQYVFFFFSYRLAARSRSTNDLAPRLKLILLSINSLWCQSVNERQPALCRLLSRPPRPLPPYYHHPVSPISTYRTDGLTSKVAAAPEALFSVWVLMGLARADSLRCLSPVANALKATAKLLPGQNAALDSSCAGMSKCALLWLLLLFSLKHGRHCAWSRLPLYR